jgi:hypothetical protein
LQQHPRHYRIGGGHPVAALQLSEEIGHSQPHVNRLAIGHPPEPLLPVQKIPNGLSGDPVPFSIRSAIEGLYRHAIAVTSIISTQNLGVLRQDLDRLRGAWED